MIRRIPIYLLAVLLLSTALLSAKSGDDGTNELKYRIKAIRGEVPSTQLDLGVPIKCGTPEMVSAFNILRHRHDVELAEAVERPSLQFAFPSQHFVIHYDTTGVNSIYDGIPDYVNRMAEIFEHVWSVEIDSMGYSPPPADNANGGDGRLDIYAVNLGFGFFGFTYPESISTGHTAFSYIVVENDFAESPTYVNRPLDGLSVTAAHEFFHTVQFGYDAFEFENWQDSDPSNDKPWWLEASSTWMEDMVYDDINDYQGYLEYFYNYLWMSLTTFEAYGDLPPRIHPYASCVWPMFITEKYDDAGVVREIWERCGDIEGYNVLPATNAALISRGSNLDDAFLEFSIWNFHTGAFADTAHYFSEGNMFPAISATALVPNLDSAPFSLAELPLPPEDLGANFIVIQPGPATGGVRIDFDGGDLTDKSWGIGVLGYRQQTGIWTSLPLTPGSWQGTGEWRNWNSYEAIAIIPVVTGVNATSETPHSYAGQLSFDPQLFFQRDIWAVQFESTPAVGRKGDPITPRVRYSNQGQESASFIARLLVTDWLGEDTVYNHTISVALLLPNNSTIVAFPQFTPQGINVRYVFKGISELEGDQSSVDDTTRLIFYSMGGVGRLLTAYPSPFIIDGINLLTIPYSYTSADLNTRLYIFDISGAPVRQVEIARHSTGGSTFMGFRWDGRNENGDYVASGIYIYVINSDGGSQTGKIAVLSRR